MVPPRGPPYEKAEHHGKRARMTSAHGIFESLRHDRTSIFHRTKEMHWAFKDQLGIQSQVGPNQAGLKWGDLLVGWRTQIEHVNSASTVSTPSMRKDRLSAESQMISRDTRPTELPLLSTSVGSVSAATGATRSVARLLSVIGCLKPRDPSVPAVQTPEIGASCSQSLTSSPLGAKVRRTAASCAQMRNVVTAPASVTSAAIARVAMARVAAPPSVASAAIARVALARVGLAGASAASSGSRPTGTSSQRRSSAEQ